MPWPFQRKVTTKLTLADLEHQLAQKSQEETPQSSESRRFIHQVPYLLPKDISEVNRLDFQHYALRSMFKGNYLAPLNYPANILDVGCGTGQWCYEMCLNFPAAQVVGFDLEPGKPTSMPNYQFVAGNLLNGLPFPGGYFDYVHQRLLVAAIPVVRWPEMVGELSRVTRPGGWIELIEGSDEIAPLGPATRQIFGYMSQLAASRGLDTNGTVARSLADYVRRAGFREIQKGQIDIPLGNWGGRIGGLMSTNFRSTFTSVREVIQSQFQLTPDAFDLLLAAMQQEWEQQHTMYRFVYIYGQKA